MSTAVVVRLVTRITRLSGCHRLGGLLKRRKRPLASKGLSVGKAEGGSREGRL